MNTNFSPKNDKDVIVYHSVTGEDTLINASDIPPEIVAVIREMETKEENYARKRRYHNDYGDKNDLESSDGKASHAFSDHFDFEEEESVVEIWNALTKTQQRRAQSRADGKSLTQIAQEEGVSVQSVSESMKAAQNRLIKKGLVSPDRYRRKRKRKRK